MRIGEIGNAVRKIGGRIVFRPGGRDKRAGSALLARLNHAAHAHGLGVAGRNISADAFSELLLAFAADPELRAGNGREHAVAGAVRKQRGLEGMILLRRHLPAGHALYAAAVHFAGVYGAVQEKLDLLLFARKLIQHAVPHRIVFIGISIVVFQHQLFQNAGFQHIFALCAAHPHADFTGRVSAEHGTLLHKRDSRAVTRRGHRRGKSRESAAYNAEIHLMMNSLKSGFHEATSL